MIKTARIRTRSIPIPPEPECPPACFVPEGPPGDDGLSGVNGADGLTIRGEDGADGEDGFRGAPGIDGIQGIQGIQGIDGLTIRGEDGEDGEDGMVIPGAPGYDGINGLTIRGADGEDGADGFSIPGLPGVDGVDGVDGAPGVTFVVTGADGEDAPGGKQFEPALITHWGTSPIIRWTTSLQWVVDGVVINGRLQLQNEGTITALVGYDGGANQTVLLSGQQLNFASTKAIGWTSTAVATNGARDSLLVRAGAPNSILFSGSDSASQYQLVSRTQINKAIAAIADATATATFTITIPNAAHSAMLKVTLAGALGAGGAIGAREALATVSYDISIARTAGVNAVANISVAYGAATSSVAGGAVMTITAVLSAIAGAVGAVNTFTVNVTISRLTGAATNHTCQVYGRLLNALASGITIA